MNQKMIMIKQAKKDIQEFLATVKITPAQWNEPLNWGGNDDLDLSNPYGAVACWVLSVYSMELGNPPFYAEFNKTCRDMDTTRLKQFGPFAYALLLVCARAERKKKMEDMIPTGESFGGAVDNLSGCFLLWRGAQMQQQ